MSVQILLIDDDSTSMELMLYLLKSYGLTTAFAFNADDGFRLAETIFPQLILCDVNMRGGSGVAFVRRMKSWGSLSQIKIVALTGMAMVGDKERLLSLGFDGYIGKPIDPEALRAQLNAYLTP